MPKQSKLERFLVKNEGNIGELFAKERRKGPRQMTLEALGKVTIREHVLRYKDEIENLEASEEDLMEVLRKLERTFISLEILEETGIGRSLHKLCRRSDIAGRVYKAAKNLEAAWRANAIKAVERRAEIKKSFRGSVGLYCMAPPSAKQEPELNRSSTITSSPDDTLGLLAQLIQVASAYYTDCLSDSVFN